jgi:hypothetical protein
MGCLAMLLPFCSKPHHPILDVVEKLHGDIYVLLLPNAPGELRVKRASVLAVSSSALFGACGEA